MYIISRSNRKLKAKAAATAAINFSSTFEDSNTTQGNTSVSLAGQTTLVGDQLLSVPVFIKFSNSLDFRKQLLIAQGGGGSVYLGLGFNSKLQDNGENSIIVKEIHMNSKNGQSEFFQEISVMWALKDCINIARMLGYSDNPNCILLRHYKYGSLEAYLQSLAQNTISRGLMYSLLHGIANGLKHIHLNGFAHCDIKTLNILLDIDSNGNRFCAITDFGLVQILSQAKVLNQFKIANMNGATVTYASPEALRMIQQSSLRADVDFGKFDIYSFGVVIYRMLTMRQPWKT